MAGTLAILLESDTRTRVLEQLLGRPLANVDVATQQSALCEVGNILASHLASGIAGTVGHPVLPSVPRLVEESVPAEIPAMVRERKHLSSALRIETEISDREGRVRAVLVFVPDPSMFVPRSRV